MKIRKARKEDLKEIDKIYVEGSLDEGKLQFPNISIKKMAKELESYSKSRTPGFAKEFNSKVNYWIVAIVNDDVVGFGHAFIKSKDIGMLEKVYVSKNFRHKGIGLKIAKELIRWLKKNKIKHIESGIYWNNKPSINFHKKLRFKPISLRMRL